MENSEKIRDLDDLISLAEDVQKNIDRNENSIFGDGLFFNLLFIILILVLAITVYNTYEYFNFNTNDNKVSRFMVMYFYAIGIGVAYIIMNFFYQKIKKVKSEILNDKKVISKIFEMIQPLKESVQQELSPVKKVTLEMRLQRINFNVDLPQEKKNTIKSSEKLVSVVE